MLRSVFLPGDRYFLFNVPYCGNYKGQLLVDTLTGRYERLPADSVVYLTFDTDTYPRYRVTGRRDCRRIGLLGVTQRHPIFLYLSKHRRYTHNRSSWSLISPRPALAPRFRSRASVQPHARPPVALRPASLLLNTAEWGHEKQISSRGRTSPGCMTVSS